jgi:hypothetical protein
VRIISNNETPSAFHTQYSIFPPFHHSIRCLPANITLLG